MPASKIPPSPPRRWLLSAAVVAVVVLHSSLQTVAREGAVRTSVFLSPPFTLEPGSVANKFYYDVNFPRGHIAIKSLSAEVVDETSRSVPLYETYLHHWLMVRYYGPLSESQPPATKSIGWERSLPEVIPVWNSGLCDNTLGQYFGLGSENRKTLTWVPDPFGIEAGNPGDVPDGHEERWMLNVHAIDTRGTMDRLGCTECRCDLYNTTTSEFERPLREGYIGGLFCCHDGSRCRVRQGFNGVPRKLYMKYTVKWVDWDDGIVPVKIYILDVTGSTQRQLDGSTSNTCKVEYEVLSCGLAGAGDGGCVDNKRARVVMPRGGDIIYGVSHQHTGGLGAALYGQDGRVLCSSLPIYGGGEESGDEAGYVVGMTTCYPSPGSARVSDGEALTFVSNYSSTQMHTGVMGLFYLLVADSKPPSGFRQNFASAIDQSSYFSWVLIAVAAVLALATMVARCRPSIEKEGYRSVAT